MVNTGLRSSIHLVRRLWQAVTLVIAIAAGVNLVSIASAADLDDTPKPLPRDVSRLYVPSKYDFKLPAWMPKPLEPRNNPTTAAKVELGRHLFYDHRLSINSTRACGTCHQQAFAFTDGQPVSRGVLGHRTKRNSMSLVNSAYLPVLMWANPAVHTLEQQMLVPLLGEDPIEMGMVGRDAIMIARLQSEPIYTPLFRAAFPESKGDLTLDAVVKSLAAFQRALISARSPYDRYKHEGDAKAISAAAIRGEQLFFGEKLKCHHCHGSFNFNDSSIHERNRRGDVAYHNTGLYNLDGKGAYPADNTGLYEHSKRPRDMGRFRAPTLRNIGVTEPYMHDGSIATLPEVLDHYAAGGRTLAEGPSAGTGKTSPLKSPLISGFEITKEERADLLAFLRSLTDMDFLFDPRFADPWPHEPR